MYWHPQIEIPNSAPDQQSNYDIGIAFINLTALLEFFSTGTINYQNVAPQG